MELTKEFFEDVKSIRDSDERLEEALYSLAESKYFSNVAVFYGDTWSRLRKIAESRQQGLHLGTKSAWVELAMPEIFLAIKEIPEDTWTSLMTMKETNNYRNQLYVYLIKSVRAGVERSLLDGIRLHQEVLRDEDEWPELPDDDESYIPDEFISSDNTEEQAMDNILLQEIKDSLDEDEWLILTSDYGDDPRLAESLGIGVGALRMRRNRIRKRVLILFK